MNTVNPIRVQELENTTISLIIKKIVQNNEPNNMRTGYTRLK